MKTRYIILYFLLMMTAIVKAADVYVDASAQGNNDGSSWVDAYTSITEAVNASANNDSIHIASGRYYIPLDVNATDASSEKIVLKDGMKLYGGYPVGGAAVADPDVYPVVLDGDFQGDGDYDNNTSIFVKVSKNCSLDGLTFVNGNQSATTESVIYFNAVGSVSVNNCKFIKNRGRIYITDGYLSDSWMTFNNCEFTENQGLTNSTGCIFYLKSGEANLIVNNSKFDSNKADAGSCYFITSAIVSKQTITDCIFTNNVSTSNGGCIYVNGGKMPNIADSSFIDNKAQGGAAAYVNGLSWQASNVLITNTVFESNVSASYGALCFNSSGSKSYSIHDCSFRNNSAANGGAMVVNNSIVNIYNSSFEENVASSKAGAIFAIERSSLNIKQTNFRRNVADVSVSTILVQDVSDLMDYTLNLENCNFENNLTKNYGAIYWERRQWGTKGVTSNFINCNFIGNSSTNGGCGAVLVTKTGGNEIVATNKFENCLFANNSSTGNGGAVNLSSQGVTGFIKSCSFLWNKSKIGSVLCLSNNDVTIENSILHGNVATNGGDVYLTGNYGTTPSNITLSHVFLDDGPWGLASDPSIYGSSIVGYTQISPTLINIVNGDGMKYGSPCLVGDYIAETENDSVDQWIMRSRLMSRQGYYDGTRWVSTNVHSPLIDAGPADWSYGEETYPHGGRINMGFDAGTAFASLSPYPGLIIIVK